MPNTYFNFKQFTINQERASFKVGTDGVLIGAAADIKDAKHILDVGSGTGLIAIMMAQRSDAEIMAIEPDKDSFEQLKNNVENCKWKDRITPIKSSLQEFTPGIKFDTIVSNPPYFIDSLKNPDKAKSLTRHSDNLGQLDILNRIDDLLEENGTLQLILPFAEGSVFIAKAAAYGLYCNELLKIKPTPASEIKRLIMKLGRKKTVVHESFLTIENSRHNFTEEYRELTKDFYLKL
jgi:tRNA1Val (adenine37-N6)-methyltransferase